jgi:hypothetical protein
METLGYEGFKSQVNSSFQIADIPIELKLVEVTERKLTSRQEMFALIFSGPREHFLEQKSYNLSHEKLGEGEMFLVPVAQEADGFKYEAVFNRLLES